MNRRGFLKSLIGLAASATFAAKVKLAPKSPEPVDVAEIPGIKSFDASALDLREALRPGTVFYADAKQAVLAGELVGIDPAFGVTPYLSPEYGLPHNYRLGVALESGSPGETIAVLMSG